MGKRVKEHTKGLIFLIRFLRRKTDIGDLSKISSKIQSFSDEFELAGSEAVQY